MVTRAPTSNFGAIHTQDERAAMMSMCLGIYIQGIGDELNEVTLLHVAQRHF
jgi:hypothetical protein